MKKTLLARMTMLIITIATLSGCILVPVDSGHRRGSSYEGDRGNHGGRR